MKTLSNSRADLCQKGDFGYIHYGDIHTRWDNTLDLSIEELPELSRDKIKKQSALIRDGDLVIADASEDYEGIAKSIEVKNLGNNKVLSGLHTFLLRDQNLVFSDGFRGYIHETPVVHQQIQKVATGLKVFGVSKNNLKEVLIPIPKPEEQEAIAAVLSDVDGLIEKLERLIAKKRDVKIATMQQLLTGKKRLPGFVEPWKKLKLGDIGNCLRGVSYRGTVDLYKSDNKNAAKLLRSNNIKSARTDYSDIQYVKRECVSYNQYLTDNDIVICMANGSKNLIGKSAYFWGHANNKFTFGAFMGCFRIFEDTVIPKFAFYLLNSDDYRKQIDILLAGSSINNLTPSAVEKMDFDFPNKDEQIAITTVLSDMDAEIDVLELSLSKTRCIKIGMMQELLTGKTRLIKTEKMKEAV